MMYYTAIYCVRNGMIITRMLLMMRVLDIRAPQRARAAAPLLTRLSLACFAGGLWRLAARRYVATATYYSRCSPLVFFVLLCFGNLALFFETLDAFARKALELVGRWALGVELKTK